MRNTGPRGSEIWMSDFWSVWLRSGRGAGAVLPQNAHEDTITMNLVEVLSKDRKARRLFHYLEFHYDRLAIRPGVWRIARGRSIWLSYSTKSADGIWHTSANA